jgi:hypothetical protein
MGISEPRRPIRKMPGRTVPRDWPFFVYMEFRFDEYTIEDVKFVPLSSIELP